MKYTGTLNKRISLRRISLLEDSDAEDKRITDEMFAKLPELFNGKRPANTPQTP